MNNDKLPPLTDYIHNLYGNQPLLPDNRVDNNAIEYTEDIILIVDKNICDDLEEVKNKLNSIIALLNHRTLTDDQFNKLFLTILDMDSDIFL